MNNTNTGGPAFPFEMAADFDGVRGKGMTLRDYFAAKALQGMLASELEDDVVTIDSYARDAYRIADAMLEVRDAKT